VKRTLHIVDGESSGGSLRGFLPKAPILVWRDALYDGPVPGNLSLHKLSRIRSQHWKAGDAFARRDRALEEFSKFEEIVLWFGPTMVCQLSLTQLLDWFSAHVGPQISLIDRDYAGWLRPDQLAPHFDHRRPVSRAMLRLGVRAWKAFTAPDGRRLQEFLKADSALVPELRQVLLRIAQEYPDASGLSRIERKLLSQFRRPQKASVGVSNAMKYETFGDSYYFDAVDRLTGGINQLLRFDEPPPENRRAARLIITEFGRKVITGKADTIAFNGIDRWIGGVHLEGRDPPRREA
jgi:hypothetical protein